jgi:hypothetical protein
MAKGNHSSPQRTRKYKARKSQLKTAKLIKQNDLLISKLK